MATTERQRIAVVLADDLNADFSGLSLEEGITRLTELREIAEARGCHDVRFQIGGSYDYTSLSIVGYRHETDEEITQREDATERKRQKKLEKVRARLAKAQAELEELESND